MHARHLLLSRGDAHLFPPLIVRSHSEHCHLNTSAVWLPLCPPHCPAGRTGLTTESRRLVALWSWSDVKLLFSFPSSAVLPSPALYPCCVHGTEFKRQYCRYPYLVQKLPVWSGEEGILKMVASNEVHSDTVPQIFRFTQRWLKLVVRCFHCLFYLFFVK